ncbi:unnamed protein product [Brachionus calyciflorus]|uniref:RHD domain-containing protein n=1 Tax=Brachionus calyciflorus TaxID=104777 RepID=A0A814GCE2_9BILA|nr:unnamed protein product [Brachionus calyciflorus]
MNNSEKIPYLTLVKNFKCTYQIGQEKESVINLITDELNYILVKIHNAVRKATLIISCVVKDQPHHVHPNRLIGDNCKSGVFVYQIENLEKNIHLKNLKIEITKENERISQIEELKKIHIDPFIAGYDFDPNSIDMFNFRLCFQVFIRGKNNDIVRDKYHILYPVLSEPIKFEKLEIKSLDKFKNDCQSLNFELENFNLSFFDKYFRLWIKMLYQLCLENNGYSRERMIEFNKIESPERSFKLDKFHQNYRIKLKDLFLQNLNGLINHFVDFLIGLSKLQEFDTSENTQLKAAIQYIKFKYNDQSYLNLEHLASKMKSIYLKQKFFIAKEKIQNLLNILNQINKVIFERIDTSIIRQLSITEKDMKNDYTDYHLCFAKYLFHKLYDDKKDLKDSFTFNDS